jgi:adenylylsulfate kinase
MTPGFTVWLTGLSGSGKSTIANVLAETLRGLRVPVVVIDGDDVRAGLSPDLGFSRADRDLQVERVGWMCDLLVRNGVVAVAALVSPYRDARDAVRQRVSRFIEVHVDASVETLMRRDTKGLYAGAAAGRVERLTGVSDPYEAPANAEVRCVSDDGDTPEACVERILSALERLELLPAPGAQNEAGAVGYTSQEEVVVRQRLSDLGYL